MFDWLDAFDGDTGLATVTLPGWYDVDDMASLRQLAAEVANPGGDAYRAPHPVAAKAAPRLGDLSDQGFPMDNSD